MLAATVATLGVTMPPVSPTGLQNRIWRWRGFDVRYQCLGDERADGFMPLSLEYVPHPSDAG